QGMDVINLSLGTRNQSHVPRLAALVARAAKREIAIVAPSESDGELCYPGCLDGAIPVGLDWDCPRDRFFVRNTPRGDVFYTSGYPRPLPGVPRDRNLNGISFAVANMTGFVVERCENRARTLGDIHRLLTGSAVTSQAV